jgi:dienelactone hydrolase
MVKETIQKTQEAGKQAGYYKNNVGDYQRRIQLALDQLVKSGANPDIVVIGYCFGGTAFWKQQEPV